MIFSQWQPDGGYVYYESSVRHPIGDDIPVRLPPEINGIGVPSQDAGVPLPLDAVAVGSGDVPRGLITPMSRSHFKTLGQVSGSQDKTAMIVVALFVTGVLLVGGLSSRRS
jgi:hypothetical protein